MFPPLTKILSKILVAGFYKVHAGLLLTLFITIFIHFFFTNVLNQTHLTSDEIILNNLKLVLTSISNPVAMGLLFIIWLIYTIKSCKYVASQLLFPEYQFLFYSSNALSLAKQFQTWFIIQFIISLPIIALGVFATIVGIIFKHYFIPLIIPLYLLLLISGSAIYFTFLINKLVNEEIKSYGLRLTKNWPKPFFSLFLYQILDKMKLTFGITKAISGIIVAGVYFLFPDKLSDMRIAGIIILGVVITHTVLIYQSNEFETIYLRFARNFPNSKKQIYLHFVALYSLMFLPEIVWLFSIYNTFDAIKISLLGLSTTLLFRTILFWFSQGISQYIRVVFGLFIVFSLMIMFGLSLLLIVINLAGSFLFFNQNYDRSLDG